MPQQNQSEILEIELIRSLFEVRLPALIMSGCFVAAGTLAVHETRDGLLTVLFAAGLIASAARLALLFLRASDVTAKNLTIGHARILQSRFATVGIGFALVLGMFAARVLRLPVASLHPLIVGLLVGYCAGIAACVGLRPRIAVPSIMVASIPASIAMLAQPAPAYWLTGLTMIAFLIGGIGSVKARHDAMVRNIGRRIAFSQLARQDGLTGLPNRLALREWFEERVSGGTHTGLVAVHCLDLDGFKPVNDRYGHPVGDALLVAVSGRIRRTIRQADLAARLGGDEFVVIQAGIQTAEQAALLAQRLTAAIALPYQIAGATIGVTSCVGYALADCAEADFDHLLHVADEALYGSKRAGGGITRWQSTCEVAPERFAA